MRNYLVIIFLVLIFVSIGCSPLSTPQPASPSPVVPSPAPEPPESSPGSYVLPTENGGIVPPGSHKASQPAGPGRIIIEDIGDFDFDAGLVETNRPDIFQPDHFSLFDALLHVAEKGDISLEHHFDEAMNTHIIDSINGEPGWWYYAYYSGGWRERNVFRMDMYPYKNNTTFRLFRENESRLEAIYNSFTGEHARLERNDGSVIIPQVSIRSPEFTETFYDVVVTPHNVRDDVLQTGVVTALDILLSLLEQGELSRLKLTWYERIAAAEPVDSYWTEQINGAEAYGTCGFVYETGPLAFEGFTGSHIHIPSDVRVILSPEYALWFWICL